LNDDLSLGDVAESPCLANLNDGFVTISESVAHFARGENSPEDAFDRQKICICDTPNPEWQAFGERKKGISSTIDKEGVGGIYVYKDDYHRPGR